MTPSDRFGKFLLLEETGQSILGPEYRAARLGPTGLERIVRLVKLSRTLAADVPAVRGLMDQLRYAARLDHSGILRTLGIGRVDGSYYVCYELVQGQSLTHVFERCRSRGRLLPMELALFMSTKICAALHYAHARRTENGRPYIHGMLTPTNVVLSYSGGVCLRGFGLWKSGLRAAAAGGPDSRYLAPEQLAGGVEDPRMDVFALGAILFEALTGRPLVRRWRSQDIELQVAQARLASAPSEPLPPPVTAVLYRALAEAPAKRFGEAHEMRQAIETFLLSRGAVLTPADLSSRMNELFAEEIEREARALAAELEAEYEPYAEPGPAEPGPARGAEAESTPAVPAPAAELEPTLAPPAEPTPAVAAAEPPAPVAGAEPAGPDAASGSPAPPAVESPMPGSYAVYVRAAAEPSGGSRWRQGVAAAVLLVALGGGAAAYRLAPGTSPQAGSRVQDATAAKVADLEKQLATLQAERADATELAVEEAAANPAAAAMDPLATPAGAAALVQAEPPPPPAGTGAGQAAVPPAPAARPFEPPAAIAPPVAAAQPGAPIDGATAAAGPPLGLVTTGRQSRTPARPQPQPEAPPPIKPVRDDLPHPLLLEPPSGFEEQFEEQQGAEPIEPVLIAPEGEPIELQPVERQPDPRGAALFAPAAQPPPVATAARPQPRAAAVAARPPAARPAAPQEAVVDLLRRYEAAIEAKDMAALKSIWPSMGQAEEEKIRRSFGFSRSLAVEIRPGDVKVAGESATLTGQRHDELVTVEGERLRSESAATFRFRNQQGRWVIEAIR